MNCPICKNSNVIVISGMITSAYCIPFYDENGNYHIHDGNISTIEYECSKHHRWKVSQTGKCGICDFGKNSEKITIIEGDDIV